MSQPLALILAAGASSRFEPLSTALHKGFIEMGGEPLVLHTLRSLAAAGITHSRIIVENRDALPTHLRKRIEAAHPDLSVEWREQPQPAGQADAIVRGADGTNQECLVLSPYHVTAGEQVKLFAANTQAASAKLLLAETQTPSEYGIVTMKDGVVTSLVEKPESAPVPSLKLHSMYLFSAEFVRSLEQVRGTHYGLEDALQQEIQKQNVIAVETKQPLPTLKYIWNSLDCMQPVISQLEKPSKAAKIGSSCVIDDSKGPVIIDPSATIQEFVHLIGPCYIGANAFIGSHSLIRSSSVETHATIGSYSEVARSYIQTGVSLHQGYVADSVIGSNTQIGAGILTANKRLDGLPIKVSIKNTLINSARRKLGLLTGENCSFGVRVTTMPGTVVPSNSVVQPHESIKHTLASQQKE